MIPYRLHRYPFDELLAFDIALPSAPMVALAPGQLRLWLLRFHIPPYLSNELLLFRLVCVPDSFLADPTLASGNTENPIVHRQDKDALLPRSPEIKTDWIALKNSC